MLAELVETLNFHLQLMAQTLRYISLMGLTQ